MTTNIPPSGKREAVLGYLSGDYRILQPGDFVRCAVTGTPIPLEELRYWNPDHQEAYATPEAMMTRHREMLEKGEPVSGAQPKEGSQ